MDIRKFFGSGAAVKAKSKDSGKTSSTPLKDTASKQNGSENKDTKKTPVKKEIKEKPQPKSESKKQPQKKKDSSSKHKDKNLNKIEYDDDIFVVDDSEDDIPVKKSKQSKNRQDKQDNGTGRGKDKRKVSGGATSEERSSKKKKKNSISSEDEFEDEPIQKSKKKKKGAASKKGTVILDTDSDEDPIPPTQEKKPRKKRERKIKPIMNLSDSEGELQPDIMAAMQKVKSKPASEAKVKSPQDKSPPKKQVSVTDFFGGAPVHRVERRTPSIKRKAESPVKVNPDEDMEIHDDDDFEKTLAQIDDTGHFPKKAKIEESKKETTKETTGSSSGKTKSTPPKKEGKSLAAKLSSRARGIVYDDYVEETPEKKQPCKSPVKNQTPLSKRKESPNKKSPSKASPGKSPAATPKAVTPKPAQKTSPANSSNMETPEMTKKKGVGFRSYLMRDGPRALGSKEIPEGGENCLEGLTFVITGVLESMERDDAKTLIERYGGKVTGNISKKTSYVIAGRDAGESKMAKAVQFSTKQIDEDGLLDLLRTLPGKKSKYVAAAEASVALERKQSFKNSPKASPKVSTPVRSVQSPASRGIKSEPTASPSQSKSATQGSISQSEQTLLWVDKYRPTSMKNIIGQTGDKSNARKLLNWLKTWHKNRTLGKKPTFNRFSDDGSGHKAALLSGPPGVGKTTSAQIVSEEAGFSFVELNASDTRSKKSMQQVVAELLTTHSLSNYFGEKQEEALDSRKHCLIMDEVDGMAGNEDRGGVQELIQLIKNTKIPIICMCNDRNHPKIRSLANHCFDLRFQRPRVEQIKAAMMSMCYKEGLKIPPPALNEIIVASNQDVRQVIHNLAMWSAADKAPTYDQLKKDASNAKKDIKIGPFDVCRKVFIGGEETAHMSIHDKSDLFFHDYSIAPLFVQENYINVIPFAARGNKAKHLECLANAADSLCDSDCVEKVIRSRNNWSLLPLEAMYASVIPGDVMRGSFPQMVSFPQWLGKNSTTNKTDRILQELRTHMSLNITGDKRALMMDYLPHLRSKLTKPLVRDGSEGIHQVIEVMDKYDLVREDFDNIIEVTQWPGMSNPMTQVETKTKSAFTRTYNKEGHLTPYAAVAVAKKKRGGGGGGGGLLEGEEDGEEEEEGSGDDDMAADAMIKAKKPTAKGRGESSATSRGRGRGKGQPKGRGRGKGKK